MKKVAKYRDSVWQRSEIQVVEVVSDRAKNDMLVLYDLVRSSLCNQDSCQAVERIKKCTRQSGRSFDGNVARKRYLVWRKSAGFRYCKI